MSNGKQTNGVKDAKVKHQDEEPEIEAAKVQVSGSVWVALIGGVVTVLTTLIGVLASNGYFHPVQSPTPTLTFTPAPAATFVPTLTDLPPSPTFTATLVPTETPIPPTLAIDTPVPCKWQVYIDGDEAIPASPACLSDLAFGNIGISGSDEEEIDFSVSNNHAGIYGMFLPLGPVQQIKKGYNFIVKLKIKELTAARFMIAFSPNPRPDVQYAYAIVINPDASRLITKYSFYPASGIPEELTFRDTPAINSVRGVDYVIEFTVSYPSLSVDVNSGSFRPKARQINFNEGGYFFIGYQRISSLSARTDIDAEIEIIP